MSRSFSRRTRESFVALHKLICTPGLLRRRHAEVEAMCIPGGGSKDRDPLQKPAQSGFPAKEFDTLFRLLRRPTHTNACHQPRVPPFPALESSQAAIVCTEITRLINFSLLGPQHGISREKIPSPCQRSKPSGPKSQTPGLSSGAPGLHQFGILHGRQRGPPSARSMHTVSSARFPGGQCPICSGPKKKKNCGLTPKYSAFYESVLFLCGKCLHLFVRD